jgi:hypothetical protein
VRFPSDSNSCHPHSESGESVDSRGSSQAPVTVKTRCPSADIHVMAAPLTVSRSAITPSGSSPHGAAERSLHATTPAEMCAAPSTAASRSRPAAGRRPSTSTGGTSPILTGKVRLPRLPALRRERRRRGRVGTDRGRGPRTCPQRGDWHATEAKVRGSNPVGRALKIPAVEGNFGLDRTPWGDNEGDNRGRGVAAEVHRHAA